MVNPKVPHIICFSSLILCLMACQSIDQQPTLTIAASANMQFAIEELTKEFTNLNGIDCNILISSSGKHTAQIMEGAPYDIFLSADTLYPQMLQAHDKSLFPPKIYAYGHLVIWSRTPKLNISLQSLQQPEIDHIAIANPKTAPYGKAAYDVLEASNLLDQIKSKLVYGENISQTNQFIISGAADIGITAKSVLAATSLKHIGSWAEIDSTLYDYIPQGIIVLNSRPKLFHQSKMFYEFVFSANGKEILNNFGYSVPSI